MSASEPSPTVMEVLRFEDLPLGSRGTRRVIARWSDGSESEALTWYADLCGYPHKSAYAESRVMPRDPGIAATRRRRVRNIGITLGRPVARFRPATA
jgi:hypothetical protein